MLILSILKSSTKLPLIISAAAIVALAIAALAAHIWISNLIPDNPTAGISQNGELLYRLPLHRDAQVELNGNTVAVRDGKVGVIAADCPNQLCVGVGFVNGALPIICLPNRVEVRVVSGNADLDGITG